MLHTKNFLFTSVMWDLGVHKFEVKEEETVFVFLSPFEIVNRNS